jgi:hypothetical protein
MISTRININTQNKKGITTLSTLFLRNFFNVSSLPISNAPLNMTKIGTPI